MSDFVRDLPPFQLLGQPSPLLERERELTALLGLVDACVREQRARAALLLAPAGMGKTCLRDELLRRACTAHPSLDVWTGRSGPHRAAGPFSLLAPALRRGLGLLEGEPWDQLREALRTRVRLHFSGEDAVRVAAFLGELLGLSFADEESVVLRAARQDALLMRHQILRAFTDILRAESALRPLLLVLEDAHWADRPSLAFLEHALRELAGQPWMLLVVGRPETRALLPPGWAARGALELELPGLSLESSRARAAALLAGRAGETTVARVAQTAAGNPRHLDELLRGVVEGYAQGAESLEVLCHARLEALTPRLMQVMRVLSIFGRTFHLSGVQALLAPMTLNEVRSAVAELCRRELVGLRREGMPDERGGFRNDALRDAVYASIPQEEREAWHRAAGEWLLLHGEGDALTVAEHFERGRAVQHAEAAFLRAARQALNAGDAAAALQQAERGLSTGVGGETRGALRLVQAEAHRALGEHELAGKRATEAVAGLTPGSRRWFRALEEAIAAVGRQSGYQRISAWTRQAMSIRPAPDAVGAQVMCLCAGTRHLFQAGSYALAKDVITRLEALAGDLDELEPLAAAQLHRVQAARARHEGDLSGDLSGYQAALSSFERAGDVRNACNTAVSVGFAFIELGEYARGEEMLRGALADAERMGLEAVATRARQNLVLVLAQRGELAEARALVTQVIREASEQRNPRFEAWSRIYASNVAARQGDFEGAEAEGRAAAQYFMGAPPARAGALAAQGRGLVGLGRAAEAAELLRDAMRVFQTTRGIEEFESLVRLVNAEVPHALGEAERAREAIRSARDRLLERAGGIGDPRFRTSFLENVPENARTLRLAKEWLGT